jgi:hypothetical protein
VQAAEQVTEERFTPGRTTLVLIGMALVLALLSALTAAGVASIDKATVLGLEVTLKKGTPTTTMISIVLAAAAAVAVVASMLRVPAELAGFKERIASERLAKRRAAAQKRADAAGGVVEPDDDIEDQPTDTPAVPAGRLALFGVFPALGVVAGIVVMIVTIA